MGIESTLILVARDMAERVSPVADDVVQLVNRRGADVTEVVLIDDGSTDDSMRRFQAALTTVPNTLYVQQPWPCGEGASMRLGLSMARGERVLALRADRPVSGASVDEMMDRLSLSALVVGHYRDEVADSRLVAWAKRRPTGPLSTNVDYRSVVTSTLAFQRSTGRLLGLTSMNAHGGFAAETVYLATALALRVHTTMVDPPRTVTPVGVSKSDQRRAREDVRSIATTPYENPVVELDAHVGANVLAVLAREARVQGLVLARGSSDALLVLPRDASLSGLGIAAAMNGHLRTATLRELIGRQYEAV